MSERRATAVPAALRERWADLRIATERLALRPVAPGDAEAIFAWFADWEVVKHLTAPPWPYALADAEAFVTACGEARDAGHAFTFAILVRGALIGTIEWRNWLPNAFQDRPGPNIGYALARSHWRQGLMSEALAAMVERVFAMSDEPAIHSGAFADNTASRRVLAKAGFVEVGRTRLPALPDGALEPHITMTLTRERWMARQ